MKNNVRTLAVLTAIGALGLSACGGGSSGASVTGTAPKAVVGAITGFGSVYVNGVEYDTSGAIIRMDDNSADEMELEVGMVVTLQGSVNADGVTGSATQVIYHDELEGVVLSNAIASGAATGTLNVMGQSVTVTATTQFESHVVGVSAPDLIVAGNVLEVSGYPDGSGNIVATRIEVKRATMGSEPIEVKGVVSSLDSNANTFVIGGLTVDYSAATMVPANLADGMYVEVHSSSAPTGGPAAYTLAASRVEMEGDGILGVEGEDGEDVQLQGLVTAVDTAAGTIDINGQTVQITGASDDHGDDDVSLASVQVGDLVRVEARFINGGLVADSLEDGGQQEGEIEFHATVAAVDVANRTVTVLGQTISLNNDTIFNDARDENGLVPEHYFGVDDVAVGDYVEVEAYVDGNGQLVAVEFKRDDNHAGGVVELKGTVTSLTPLQVAGIDVDLTAVAGLTPALGMVLEMRGTMSGGTLVATAATIDD